MGTILTAAPFAGAKKPAYQLSIDFGDNTGIKKSSAQITMLYETDSLIGMQVIAIVNFPPKFIAGFRSECLVLGIYREDGAVVLLQPGTRVTNGLKIG